jgi:outer membrane protein assembly factor BamB
VFRFTVVGIVLALTVGASTGWGAAPREKWRFTGGSGPITLADIDGDGQPEILFATAASGSIFCVDGQGKLRFQYREQQRIRYICYVSAADLDGDGRVEVIAVGRERRAICLTAEGKLRWRRWLPRWAAYHGGAVIADVTGDGRSEMFFGVDGGRLYCLDADGNVVWLLLATGDYGDPPVVGDVNGDGEPEILVGSPDKHLYCIDRRGNQVWASEANGECASGPVLADLEEDGRVEVLYGSNDGTLHCVSGADGAPVWEFKVGTVIRTSISVADLNGDGKPEVLVGCMDALRCLSSSGKLLWQFTPKGGKLRAYDCTPVVGDINGDGKPEVVVGGNGHLYCVDAAGHELWELGGIDSTPALGDVDGDGKLEIVCGGKDGIVCLATDAPYRPQSILWGQTRLNANLNASLLKPRPAPQQQIITTYKETRTPGLHVCIVAEREYPSYAALGNIDVYLDSLAPESLKEKTLVVEVEGEERPIFSCRCEAGGRHSVVEHVPLGTLLKDEAKCQMQAWVEDTQGKMLAQAQLELERVTPEPLLKEAGTLDKELDRMAAQLGDPPLNSPAEFTQRLVAVGKYYVEWARDDIKAQRLSDARARLLGLRLGLSDLAKRVQAAAEPAARQAQDYPGYRKGHIAFDAGTALLIDGKPTFPVGIYNAGPSPQEVADVARMGFDVTFTGGGPDFWRACADHGVYAVEGLAGEALADFRRVLSSMPSIETISREKALLAWYVVDEPTHREVAVETMRRICQAVRMLDPYHPTLICDGKPGGGALYTAVADIALPAFYPFWHLGEDAREVADRMDEATQANQGRIPTWFVVQAFTGLSMPFATPAEERAMAFLVIIHGGRGVHYFRYLNPKGPAAGGDFYIASRDDPALWAGIQRDVKDMKALEPYLVAAYRRMEVLREGERRLDFCVIKRGEEVLVIACNPTYSAARWKLGPRELAKASGTAQVVLEDRAVALEEGVIEDDFQPQQVHVYLCKP